MHSGNRSGGLDSWEGGGAAGAEGPGLAGTLSPGSVFNPSTYERLALLLGSIGLLGVANNLLVLVFYYKFQQVRTPFYLFLVNISFSDLLVSFFGVTFTFVSCLRNGWVWDTVGCVWDGFSSSLFGELGWRRKHPPLLSRLSILCIATVSVRPLATQPTLTSLPLGLVAPTRPSPTAPPLPHPKLHGILSSFLPYTSTLTLWSFISPHTVPTSQPLVSPSSFIAVSSHFPSHLSSVFTSSCNSTRLETTAFTL